MSGSSSSILHLHSLLVLCCPSVHLTTALVRFTQPQTRSQEILSNRIISIIKLFRITMILYAYELEIQLLFYNTRKLMIDMI